MPRPTPADFAAFIAELGRFLDRLRATLARLRREAAGGQFPSPFSAN
jgi:hypothetical protein